VKELDDVPESQLTEIAHFFSIYKELEPRRVTASLHDLPGRRPRSGRG
jgi:inorganic pyrophosphatase